MVTAPTLAVLLLTVISDTGGPTVTAVADLPARGLYEQVVRGRHGSAAHLVLDRRDEAGLLQDAFSMPRPPHFRLPSTHSKRQAVLGGIGPTREAGALLALVIRGGQDRGCEGVGLAQRDQMATRDDDGINTESRVCELYLELEREKAVVAPRDHRGQYRPAGELAGVAERPL